MVEGKPSLLVQKIADGVFYMRASVEFRDGASILVSTVTNVDPKDVECFVQLHESGWRWSRRVTHRSLCLKHGDTLLSHTVIPEPGYVQPLWEKIANFS